MHAPSVNDTHTQILQPSCAYVLNVNNHILYTCTCNPSQVTQLPEKDELSWSKKQLLARMDVAMGGRVAEEIVFGLENITTGASSDLEHATQIATKMATKFGMTESVSVAYMYMLVWDVYTRDYV